MDNKQCLRTDEAASFLSVSIRTLKHWRKNHLGPPYSKVARTILYDLKDLEAWLENHKHR